MKFSLIAYISVFLSLFTSCTKEETIVIANNEPPSYSGVSTLQIENYVQRLFIDLLGREASDSERMNWVKYLKLGDLKAQTRDSMVYVLQTDTTYREGDSSYRHAYIQRLYEIMKLRFLEGASNPEIAQKLGNIRFAIEINRLNGDSVMVQQLLAESEKYTNLLNWSYQYLHRNSSYELLCNYLMYNGVYDIINMGSFNFINAAFDDALGRLPDGSEFESSFKIIEKNEPARVFGRIAANKLEFINVLTESTAFGEAQIRWWYFQYSRNTMPSELLWKLLNTYRYSKDIEWLQRQILIRDEYAQF